MMSIRGPYVCTPIHARFVPVGGGGIMADDDDDDFLPAKKFGTKHLLSGGGSSSKGKQRQKKDVPTPAYGKAFAPGQSFFLYCPPLSIYKKAKQAPENKHEAYLIKELEEILSREGLSSNPSEKDQDIVAISKQVDAHNFSCMWV